MAKKNQNSKSKKRKQQQQQQQPKKRELIDPNAGTDGLGVSRLQNLVRAAQKHQVGDWQGFIKHACSLTLALRCRPSPARQQSVAPKQKKIDPAAHTEEVLRAFVKHLQDGHVAANTTPASNKSTQPINPATFVQRYLKWAHQLQKVSLHFMGEATAAAAASAHRLCLSGPGLQRHVFSHAAQAVIYARGHIQSLPLRIKYAKPSSKKMTSSMLSHRCRCWQQHLWAPMCTRKQQHLGQRALTFRPKFKTWARTCASACFAITATLQEQVRKATSVVPPSVIKALTPAPFLSQNKDGKATPSTASGTPAAGSVDGGSEKLTSPWGLVHASRNHPRQTTFLLPALQKLKQLSPSQQPRAHEKPLATLKALAFLLLCCSSVARVVVCDCARSQPTSLPLLSTCLFNSYCFWSGCRSCTGYAALRAQV
eukprot:1161665-Pelagomonas_calceolata.AAC.2